MGVLRWEFRTTLVRLEDTVLRLGRRVEGLLPQAVAAMCEGGADAVASVVAVDDDIDVEAYEAGDQIYAVLATQSPVAGDLRLLIGLMHALRSVERIGDYCVNIARLSAPEGEQGKGVDPALQAQVMELAGQAERAIDTGLSAFARRLSDGLARAERVENPLDTLQAGLMRRLVVHGASSPAATGWSMRMMLATRHLERIGDHALSIAEQGVFVATGAHRPPRHGVPGAPDASG